jgi:hypothetical protein
VEFVSTEVRREESMQDGLDPHVQFAHAIMSCFHAGSHLLKISDDINLRREDKAEFVELLISLQKSWMDIGRRLRLSGYDMLLAQHPWTAPEYRNAEQAIHELHGATAIIKPYVGTITASDQTPNDHLFQLVQNLDSLSRMLKPGTSP